MTTNQAWTEKTVLDAIEPRYRKPGNGGSGEYAFLRQVRNDAGFNASRTFDAVAVHLWPSRGFAVDVIEVKVSRSDWLRELREPAKAEAAFKVANRFIVAAPAGICQPAEVPPGWGLLEVTEKRNRMTVQPTVMHQKRRETFPAGFVIAMLRAAGAAALRTPDDVEVERRVAEALAGAEERKQAWKEEVRRVERERAEVALTFLSACRLPVHDVDGAREHARRVREVLNADQERVGLVRTLRHQRDRLDRMIGELDTGGDQ